MTEDKLQMYESFGIDRKTAEFGEETAAKLVDRFQKVDDIAEFCQYKVIRAMQENHVGEACLYSTTGYGYNDLGRETLEKVYASYFHTEDALVRPTITCGTHALGTALAGNLRPGDELLSPVGTPYDTLQEVIGIRPSRGSLAEYGVHYNQVDLLPDESFDYDGIAEALICMVDNCYGEFTERIEPSDVGADMVVGSLIKNPGGGLAPIGGYIAGTADCIQNAACHLTTPGLGKEVGATIGTNRYFYQGFYMAPTVTASALKSAIFAANLYEPLGFKTTPNATEDRHDIIQSIVFGKPEGVIAFCQGIQAAAPVDSYVTPEPWPMPGYDSDVIMAAGAFVQGSSIELSADGPIRPPYAVFFQGGLTWPHGKLGIIMSLQKVIDAGLVKL